MLQRAKMLASHMMKIKALSVAVFPTLIHTLYSFGIFLIWAIEFQFEYTLQLEIY